MSYTRNYMGQSKMTSKADLLDGVPVLILQAYRDNDPQILDDLCIKYTPESIEFITEKLYRKAYLMKDLVTGDYYVSSYGHELIKKLEKMRELNEGT
jgi:hypothetical protein